MATFRLSKVILNDRWPGTPSDLPVPINGWDNTLDNFKTTASTDLPRYPLGTKIRAYTDNTNCPGWYTMMYLQFHCYSTTLGDVTADFSDGYFWCAPTCSTAVANPVEASAPGYYVVSKCTSAAANGYADHTKGAPVCVPCAEISGDGSTAYANSYGDSYGWFWVGGVCPCKDVTIMDDAAGSTKGADFTVGVVSGGGGSKNYCFRIDGTGVMVGADMSNDADATALQKGPSFSMVTHGWVCASV